MNVKFQWRLMRAARDAGPGTWMQCGLCLLVALSARATPIAQYPVAPADCVQPHALALDALGDAWFGCAGQNVLVHYAYTRVPYLSAAATAKSSGSSSATVVHLPTGISLTEIAIFDHGGNLWLSAGNDRIVRYAPTTGATQTFTATPGSRPVGLAAGPDGNIWYSAYETGKIGRLNPATGAFVEFSFPALTHPYRIVVGPDGNLWVGSFSNYVARVTPAGVITEYPIGGAAGLTFAPDGNLWHANSNFVGRFNPATGAADRFTVPDVNSLRDLVLAPDGTLWWGGIKGNNTGRIGQITLQGDVAPVVMPATAQSVYNIAIRASDGQLFYADPNAKEIGVIDPAFATAPDATVVEFRNSILNHYFLTANVDEANAIDTGSAGPGWSRTNETFKAWLAGPIPQASRICRFYGTPGLGPNSHFFTISAEECAAVRKDPGWTPEDAGRFWLVTPATACPSFTQNVYRVYNQRFMFNDSNHRYLTSVALYNQMVAQGWAGEGVVFCAPR